MNTENAFVNEIRLHSNSPNIQFWLAFSEEGATVFAEFTPPFVNERWEYRESIASRDLHFINMALSDRMNFIIFQIDRDVRLYQKEER